MTIFFLNVRGLNQGIRMRDYMHLFSTHKPSIVGLVETKIKEINSSRLLHFIPAGWQSMNNYSSDPHGRIWILWDSNVWSCSMVQASSQHITISAINQGGLCFLITFIYAFNLASERQILWSQLQKFSTTHSQPWLLLGDLNTVRSFDEKIGGRSLQYSQIRELQDFINKTQLLELHSTSPGWTWHNMNVGSSRIYAQLDRILCNTHWLSLMPSSYYETLSHLSSDHKPLLLHLIQLTRTNSKPFKYFKSWQSIEGYKEIVQQAWSISPLATLYTKLGKSFQVSDKPFAVGIKRKSYLTLRVYLPL